MQITLFEALIVSAGLGIIGAVVWTVYDESQRPSFELNTAEWECTKTESRTQLQWTGKVAVPITRHVCMEYKRIGG